jgi:hypothetical protein
VLIGFFLMRDESLTCLDKFDPSVPRREPKRAAKRLQPRASRRATHLQPHLQRVSDLTQPVAASNLALRSSAGLSSAGLIDKGPAD